MKATTATLAAMMAAGALAQPHHPRHVHQQHHRNLHARDVTETVWTTEWVTEYVTVDATTTMSGSPGILIESSTSTTSSSSSSSSSTSSVTSATSTESPKSEKPTTSSTPPPPEPTTSKEEEVVVVPTPSPEADTKDKDKGSNTGGGIGSAQYAGFITYYDIGLGACGWSDSGRHPTGSIDDPMVVAISYNSYFAGLANPNNMPLCGKKIAMESPDNPGVVAYGVISDACQACTTPGDLDVNIEGMENFYPGSVVQKGKGSITWKII